MFGMVIDIGTNPIQVRDLKIKVTDLKFVCKSFPLKILQCQHLQSV